jgi:ribosomal protein RSM22 (predicted rRNA methylase)
VSILDVGAGLGASTIGVTMALRRAGFTGEVRSEMIDADGAGLDVARALTRRVDGLTATAEVGDASRLPRGRRDIVVIVQTVCELDRQLPEVERVGRHVAWLEHVIDHLLNPGGVLIVVEPALSGPARHLMSVRDGLARAGRRPFAPCTHAAACPMLADPRDWCHERRFVNLPPWLVPVAKSAGLRWESLTFSLLVIRQDRAVRGPAWRVVSDPLESKGRLDRWLCGQPEGEVAVLSRGGRMNRFRTPENAVWDELGRGDTLAPWEGAVASIGREVRLRRWDGGDGGSDAG